MKYLVIDVAAEHSGALSILKRFVEGFKSDVENEYVVCVSNLDFADTENVKFLKFPWVKKSKLHRLYFDSFFVKKLVKKYSPDKILSLQNKGFAVKNIPQDVYFHNALFICEKRFSPRESKSLWIYQNVIAKLTKKSMRFADKIIVQGEWIKNALGEKWGISTEKIVVDRPSVNPVFSEAAAYSEPDEKKLFYPANFSIYKNHRTLLSACLEVWKEKGENSFALLLTGKKEAAPSYLREAAERCNMRFLGALTPEEMKDVYLQSTLVFPSYIETVGLPLLEAKELCRPIIAADCEYAREAVGEYDKADYFSPFSVAELKSLIEERIK